MLPPMEATGNATSNVRNIEARKAERRCPCGCGLTVAFYSGNDVGETKPHYATDVTEEEVARIVHGGCC